MKVLLSMHYAFPSLLAHDSRRQISSFLFVLASILTTFSITDIARGDDQPSPPNIVVVLADDLGWGDLGCYGHPLMKTPHLDAFAKQGLRLTQCYSACGVCSPSRSAILTGRTPYRNGVFRWIPENHECHLRTSEIAFPKLLQQRGYQTCHVGKWHLNGFFNSSRQPQPNDHGFDHWLATQNNAAPSHKDPVNFVRNGEPVGKLEGYSAHLLVDEAIDWLQRRDVKRPFFLNVWTHEPHLPIESAPEYQSLYDSNDEGLKQHHGDVSQLDAAFGRLMKKLDELELTDNTIVFFTADNGPEGNGQPDLKHPGSQNDRNRGSTGGLRGRKRADFEGGIRVPGLVRWPGKITPGRESDSPVIGTDLFATILEIAGVPVPPDRKYDGESIVPLLRGESFTRSLPMYWRTHISPPDCRVAVRQGDWKIVANTTLTQFLLFDVAHDPRETNDLATREPMKFEEMKKLLLALDQEILAEGPKWWQRDEEDSAAKPKAKRKAE